MTRWRALEPAHADFLTDRRPLRIVLIADLSEDSAALSRLAVVNRF